MFQITRKCKTQLVQTDLNPLNFCHQNHVSSENLKQKIYVIKQCFKKYNTLIKFNSLLIIFEEKKKTVEMMSSFSVGRYLNANRLT